jgi:NADPH-dependent ferric siderophore reductase
MSSAGSATGSPSSTKAPCSTSAGTDRVLLVADETGLPAAAGILASLAKDVVGQAVLEVPSGEDRPSLDPPPGVEVVWVTRNDPRARPGRAAVAAAQAQPHPPASAFAWTVGEQALPTTLRRHWITAGIPKDQIMFCGNWKVPEGR